MWSPGLCIEKPSRTAATFNKGNEIMKLANALMLVAGALAVTSCGGNARDEAADRVEENAEARAETIEDVASNRAEAIEEAGENQAETVRELGDESAEAVREGAGAETAQ